MQPPQIYPSGPIWSNHPRSSSSRFARKRIESDFGSLALCKNERPFAIQTSPAQNYPIIQYFLFPRCCHGHALSLDQIYLVFYTFYFFVLFFTNNIIFLFHASTFLISIKPIRWAINSRGWKKRAFLFVEKLHFKVGQRNYDWNKVQSLFFVTLHMKDFFAYER